MKRAVELGEFRGLNINEDEFVDILQFIGDTIILGDGSSDNIWSVKDLLGGFKMISGVRVDIYKSNIFGINVYD